MLYANDGLVSSPEKLGFIMRSLDMKPTMLELKDYFEKHKKGIKSKLILLKICKISLKNYTNSLLA